MQDKRISQILKLVTSGQHNDQLSGYRDLRNSAGELVGCISRDDAIELLQAIADIKNADLLATAQSALNAVLLMWATSGHSPLHEVAEAKPEIISPILPEPKHIGEFLIRLFALHSAVITVTGAENNRRDEHAENFWGRRLSFERNPKTEFIKFSADSARAHLDLPNKNLAAICVVGRPGLYGSHFLETIHYPQDFAGASPENRPAGETSLRFGFKLQERPADVPHNQLHEEYHCISERIGPGVFKPLRTTDDKKTRCDFGLVQHYITDIQGRQTVILVAAGASSLGTLGAAWWAAFRLFPRENDPGSESAVIPMPDGSKEFVKLEALVRVTADSTQAAWPTPHVVLESLTFGNKSWCDKERRWMPKTPDLITLIYRDTDVIQINFDGEKHRIAPGSRMFILIKGLAEMALKGTSQWTVGRLCEMKDLWGTSTKKPPKNVGSEHVNEQLRILRQRHLGMGLAIEGENVSLQCRVENA